MTASTRDEGRGLENGNPVQPRKLLNSKWTAVTPVRREKHFIVVRLIEPATPDGPITHVELEAVLSRRTRVLAWQDLRDASTWRQGWT